MSLYYSNQTIHCQQILGDVGVMHCRDDAPWSNPTCAILNFFSLKNWRDLDFYEQKFQETEKFHVRKVKCLVRATERKMSVWRMDTSDNHYNQLSYMCCERVYFYSHTQLYGQLLNTDTSIIITDSLASPWGKKALTFFQNSTCLIRTPVNMDTFYGHLSFCINGVWLYHYYEKICSRPFCPSLSHLSAVHQPCACDCTECVEEMTCHISQHTRPARNINMLVSNLHKNKGEKFKCKCHWLL